MSKHRRPGHVLMHVRGRRRFLMDQLALTLQLYDIPDVDFTFFLKDEPVCDLPYFNYCVDTGCGERGGFTIPSYGAFHLAFGEKQMDVYTSCLDMFFPLTVEDRILKAFWRGSSTGYRVLSIETLPKFYRIQLASLSEQYPEILDAGITDYIQVNLFSGPKRFLCF